MDFFELEDGRIIGLASIKEFDPKHQRIKHIFTEGYTYVSPVDRDKLIKALRPTKRIRKAAPKE